MRRVGFRRVVDFVENPAGRIIDMLAHIESQTSSVAGHGLPGIVQKQAFEFREHLGPNGDLDENHEHRLKTPNFQLPTPKVESREPKAQSQYTFPMSETIGFIGLGLMGRPMAKNVLKKGYPLVVHSRSQGPVDDLVAAGAARASSPAEVARRATRIITMVPDSADVELVLDGPNGVFSAIQPGTIIIDMSSIAPRPARRLAERAKSLGATMLDAPVSGGDIGAVAGTLSIMVGGDLDAFTAVKPLLDAMGNPEKVVRVGESGAGQLCKLCNQMVIGGTLVVVAEALALARKAGVDAGKVREALLGGFAASRVLEVHGERALKGTYKPGFKTHLFAKDMRNVVSTLAEHDAAAPVTAVVQQLLHATMAAGRGEDDNSIMAKTVFELAGLE
jgi:2-hydroxy-3-oxopropionate reductase